MKKVMAVFFFVSAVGLAQQAQAPATPDQRPRKPLDAEQQIKILKAHDALSQAVNNVNVAMANLNEARHQADEANDRYQQILKDLSEREKCVDLDLSGDGVKCVLASLQK
jgi:chromatin segregation and condensation protein Rec8/ScpA/Scc1 (kleisin family)